MPDFLKPHIPEDSIGDKETGFDLKLLLKEDFQFSSKAVPGLELVDILVNATRRALMQRLGIDGWCDIPRLMIHSRQHYIRLIAFRRLSPRHGWQRKLTPVLNRFSRDGKNMLAPRFLTQDVFGREPTLVQALQGLRDPKTGKFPVVVLFVEGGPDLLTAQALNFLKGEGLRIYYVPSWNEG